MNRSLTTYYLLVFLSSIFIGLNSLGFEPQSNIKQYEKLDYGAASQNWSISTTKDGFIYFANHQGLLQFDGVSWKLHSLPNNTTLRDVNVASDSIIYTGGYLELGYWKPDQFGTLQYYSLSEKAKQFFTKNEEFWNIEVDDSTVYFQSYGSILAYRNDSIYKVSFPGFTSLMSKVRDQILFSIKDRGIYQIEDNVAKPYITDPFFEDKTIRFLLPFEEDKILIGTSSYGIFVLDQKKITSWNPGWTQYFIDHDVNRGHVTKNGNVVIGSIIDGIVIFDNNGNLISKVNTSVGLPNNTVLGINSDPWGNIWVALDRGIGFIANNGKKSYKIESIPDIGAVYAAAIHKGYFYLGTNQGLFAKQISSSDTKFELIPNTQAQVWDLKIIDDHLFAGHNEGTFIVEGMNANRISHHSGGFAILKDKKNPDKLMQSTYSSLVTYKKAGEEYELDKNIQGFYDLIRYIEVDHMGNLWASHMHRGIFKLYLDDSRENIIHEKYYGANVFGKDHSVHVFEVEDRIVFTTNQQLYTFDDLNDTIVPFYSLNKHLDKYASSSRIVKAPNHHYWFLNSKHIGLFKISQDSVKLIHEYPTQLFNTNPLVDGFENIMPLTETKAILCLQNGIAHLDASVSDTALLINQFTPQLRVLELNNNRGNIQKLSTKSKEIKVKHNYHNLSLKFAFPQYTAQAINYQYHLEGLYLNWSEKIPEPDFRFDRLPEGSYKLLVKAVDLWDNESQVYELLIEILPPWYASIVARILYVILLILILIGVRSRVIKQTKKKIQVQHEKKEKELIKLRNEKLRNEVSHKSKELANSTMSIIKKNEFLLDLKKILVKQKEELGSRYPDKYFNHLSNKIEENISSHDDWQLFETNFERAHEQFLHKIKEQYPDLTSKDLRLCAYLRMNLSSKEIAPLLGISVRGVENHRYRLRKKMHLEHDEKLIDLILTL